MSSKLDKAFEMLYKLVGGALKSELFVVSLEAAGESAVIDGKLYWDLEPIPGFAVIDVEKKQIHTIFEKTDALDDETLLAESDIIGKLFALTIGSEIHTFLGKILEVVTIVSVEMFFDALIKMVEADVNSEEGKSNQSDSV
jgi:hypothetical protein